MGHFKYVRIVKLNINKLKISAIEGNFRSFFFTFLSRQDGFGVLVWDNKTTNPFPYYTYGAGVTEVEVDCTTGSHVVSKTYIGLLPEPDILRFKSSNIWYIKDTIHIEMGLLLVIPSYCFTYLANITQANN